MGAQPGVLSSQRDGMGEGREAHEGGGIYIVMTDLHCIALWQKPAKCCKAMILQLIFLFEKEII